MTWDDETIVRTIAGLHAESWRTAYRGLYSDRFLDFEVADERLAHWRKRLPELRAGVGEIFLADMGGEPAGFACVEIEAGSARGTLVDNLHVLPRFQGNGIGRLLLNEAARWARAHGESALYLWVLEDNHAARRFYQADGWHVVGRDMHDLAGEGRASVLRLVKAVAAGTP